MKLIATALLVFIIACISSKNLLFAQDLSQFRLLDQSTRKPIVGATYHYNNKTGISDENGVVEFRYVEGTTMKLTHINYGQWVLGDRNIQKSDQKE